MKKLSYKEKFIQMNKEAKATWAITGVLICFWWLAAFGTAQWDYTVFFLPGWFVTSCLGTYVLSIALVWLIVKKVFVDFDLEDDEDEAAEEVKNRR